MNDQIGLVAGQIYQHLKNNGPSSSLELKLSLNRSASELFLALGWLCREGKIQILPDHETYKIQFREVG